MIEAKSHSEWQTREGRTWHTRPWQTSQTKHQRGGPSMPFGTPSPTLGRMLHECIHAAISEAVVQTAPATAKYCQVGKAAFPKQFYGKASGRTGWPAELLRYAACHVEGKDGKPWKVWILGLWLAVPLQAGGLLRTWSGPCICHYYHLWHGLLHKTLFRSDTIEPGK